MSVVSDPQDLEQFETAVKLMQQNQLNEAKRLLVQLLEKNPANAAVQHKLAEIYLAIEQYDTALPYLLDAVQHEPSNAYYLYRLGYLMLKMGHTDQAIKSLTLATKIDPTLAEPYSLLGTIYQNQGKDQEALQCYLAKAEEMQIPEIFEAIGQLYQKQEQFSQAQTYYTKALELRPDMTTAQTSLASALVDQLLHECRYDSATAATVRSLCQQQANSSLVKRTLANLEGLEGNSANAIQYYREALELKPDDNTIRANLAITLLRSGYYQEGWSDLRWRQDLSSHDHGFISKTIAGVLAPQWQGEQKPGMTLLVTSEQGVGDQVLHVQHLVPLLKAGINIVLTCNVKLVSLFQHSFPEITVLPDNEPVPTDLQSRIDAQVFLLDVPYLVKLDLPNYHAPKHYIKAHPELTKQFRQDMIKNNSQAQYHIGIAWQSSSGSSGAGKSIALQKLVPLLRIPNCQFVSIQYGDAVQAALALEPGLIYVDTTFNPFDDLEKAAAQIAALDRVIAVSNAAVHLAGALAIPTWVMTQYVPLWHWFEKREDSPWYSSVRLFRQPNHGDWESVIQRVCNELQHLTTD
ncbi:tetratricopeptide repeat protein [Spartinivicinus poritis]|uniref:Tetratricopeptide repeat protein n=1 Tax=Spartinivicinus poritis TaxID=2994640 RepID=A0ABT5UB26_9GAMM|nr:tetratricopeptide repeat protein [Spartinivicinus sp. A2-2]MDE1463517.1 tetratricopeptide repeat protein [Spartinivicinus sp. A2-2]